MKEYQSLSHTTWDCKYHVVFIPKCRKQRIFGALRREPGTIFHELAGQKESQIVEGHCRVRFTHRERQAGCVPCTGNGARSAPYK